MYNSSTADQKFFYYVSHVQNIVKIFVILSWSAATAVHSNFSYKIFSAYRNIKWRRIEQDRYKSRRIKKEGEKLSWCGKSLQIARYG